MKPRTTVAALAIAALGALPLVPALAPAPAQAAAPAISVRAAALKAKSGVTIAKIGTKTVKVKVTKKLLTVKKGSRTIVKNKASVKLAAGTYKVTTKVYYKTYVLKGSAKKWSGTKSFSATQSLKVKRATSTTASGSGNCPSWAPVKGNNNSMIYHVPSARYYSRTTSNVTCFVSGSAAAKAGFRAAKV